MNTQKLSYPPSGLTRSGVACWWSIKNLVEDASVLGIPCYLWTLTFPKTYPDGWCGNMHRNLVRHLTNDAKRRPRFFPHGFAAVRVVEEHPGGHGLHYHWVVRGRMPLKIVRSRAQSVGFGHIFIARDKDGRFRRCDTGVAGYVAKYLVKQGKLHGVRAWSCIGSYTGVKTADVEFDSDKNRVFKQAYKEAKQSGLPAPLCYNHAVVSARQWEHEYESRD